MYNEEIEKAVLYSIIFENKNYEIKEKDFVNDRNIKIAKAIIILRDEKRLISMLAITEKIKANKKQIIEYISSLADNVYKFNGDENYNTLIELSKKRELYRICQETLTEIEETENVDDFTFKLKDKLENVIERNEKEESLKEQINQTIEDIENTYKNRNDLSLYTGIHKLDGLTCGLHKQELTIIGARPGVGKTTFALQIAEHIADKNKNVVLISLEMSSTQLIKKIISKKSNVNSYKMRLGTLEEKDFEKIINATNELYNKPLMINTRMRSIQQIELFATKIKNKGKLDVLIIDYIQLLKSSGKFNSREQEVADISRRLKLLSLELNIPIIALCQLNRNASKNEPTNADLRESGSLEQDADNIIFLYYDNEEDEKIRKITIKLAKQRAGETGKLQMIFDKMIGEFKEAGGTI